MPAFRTRALLLGLLLIGVAGNTGPSLGTTAYFADAAASTSNGFTSGTIALSKSSPAGAVFTVSGLYPGQSTTPVSVALNNSGTLPLQYTMSTTLASGSAALASEVQLTVTEGACPGSTSLYSGAIDSAAIALRPSTPLAAGASESLCFTATLPSTASNSLQSLSSDFTFTFVAQQ